MEIPRPTQTAESREMKAWENLRSRPPQAVQLIIQIKRDLEGGESVEWAAQQGARGRGRPSKGSRGEKIMSYQDAERWLTRAESVGRQRTLEEVVEALAQRQEARAAQEGPASAVGEGGQREGTGQGWALQVTAPRGGSLPPPSNQLQQLPQYGEGQRIVLQASIGQLLAVASRIKLSARHAALATMQNRLYKALYGRKLDEATATIMHARQTPDGEAVEGERRHVGTAEHARNSAWAVIRGELAGEPEKLRQLGSISTTAASRWQQFFERLGHGVVFLVNDAELPNSFIEKDLNNVEFQRFLDLVERMNPGVVELGKAIWEAVDGSVALNRGDFSFSNVDIEAIRQASAQMTGTAAVSQSNQGAIVGEVMDTDDDDLE